MNLEITRLHDGYQWSLTTDFSVSHSEYQGDLSDVFLTLERLDINLTDSDMLCVEELEIGQTFVLPKDESEKTEQSNVTFSML